MPYDDSGSRGCARALNPGLWLFDPLRGLNVRQGSALALDREGKLGGNRGRATFPDRLINVLLNRGHFDETQSTPTEGRQFGVALGAASRSAILDTLPPRD
jgi:hypothetical protein